ncbi:MAG TPA: alpha/beta fold hydrolase [Rhizomicrobium sp.]|nr:alpha/beta fold hydrolase [Rhizomicrobium sp.]
MNAPVPSPDAESRALILRRAQDEGSKNSLTLSLSKGEAGTTSTDVELLLLDIWQRVLRVPEIGRDDNFFDLGGDSLLAVNLFLEIEKETGVHLPITVIYDAPTIAEMARLVEDETASESSCLVLLKPGTGDRPLFIAHGIGGTVIELAALGRAVRIPDAVYAIQARGLDGREPPHVTIEAMVDHYVQAIRAVQPSGPYRLCGYSFGGLIAMEIARRLKAQGRSIAALILMDAYAHPRTWPVLSRVKMKLRRSLHLFVRSPGEILGRVFRRAKDQSESMRLHEWLLDQNPSLPLPLLRVREAGGAALSAYRPKPYAGRIMFLRAKKRDAEFPDDPKRIWRRLALDIAFRTIPGGHRTIVTQHAETAAAAITACLSSGRGGIASLHQRGRFASPFKATTAPALREAV